MLFNSYVFIFAFFPLVFFAFFRIGKYSHRLAMLWLAAASLFFYGWWDARFVGLLLGSITFNYSAAYLMGTRVARHAVQQARMLLIGAVACNLALLGYFKYANFFAENLNRFAGQRCRSAKCSSRSAYPFSPLPRLPFSWIPIREK